MPGKPRPRPEKVLYTEIFPVCPFTDPLSNDDDPETESRGFAYLSDRSTVIDTLLNSRFNDNGWLLSSYFPSTDPLNSKAAATSRDSSQGSLVTKSEINSPRRWRHYRDPRARTQRPFTAPASCDAGNAELRRSISRAGRASCVQSSRGEVFCQVY